MTDSILISRSDKPFSHLCRPFEGGRFARFLFVRVGTTGGIPVASMQEAEDRLLAMVPVTEIDAKPCPETMTPEAFLSWRVVVHANRAGTKITTTTRHPSVNLLLMNPKLAAHFGGADRAHEEEIGRWKRMGILGLMNVWLSDAVPENEFIVACSVPLTADRGMQGPAVLLTADDGSLHLVSECHVEKETPLCGPLDYLARFRLPA